MAQPCKDSTSGSGLAKIQWIAKIQFSPSIFAVVSLPVDVIQPPLLHGRCDSTSTVALGNALRRVLQSMSRRSNIRLSQERFLIKGTITSTSISTSEEISNCWVREQWRLNFYLFIFKGVNFDNLLISVIVLNSVLETVLNQLLERNILISECIGAPF